jgi:AcrR family transcriptional regulator
MPPRVKFQKEEIVTAALEIARERGIDAVTAREVANALGVSTRPIFTYYETMDQLKADVFALTKERYRAYIERGLEAPIPFLGIWQQYLAFARSEPELYRMLFLTRPGTVSGSGGAMEALKLSQDLARESLMRIYNLNADAADRYFRDLWLVAFSFATLVVTDDCPFTDEEIFATGAEISLSICKAYKEIPGLPEGNYDRDAIFRELVKK